MTEQVPIESMNLDKWIQDSGPLLHCQSLLIQTRYLRAWGTPGLSDFAFSEAKLNASNLLRDEPRKHTSECGEVKGMATYNGTIKYVPTLGNWSLILLQNSVSSVDHGTKNYFTLGKRDLDIYTSSPISHWLSVTHTELFVIWHCWPMYGY